MAAVTWKNIAPSNPSGILNSMNTSAAALATAGKGIGDAASGYVDDRQEAETNAFVTDLMAAGSQEERDAMIGAANNSFLDMKSVNATNYELGAPKRAADIFTDQLAQTQASQIEINTAKSVDKSIAEKYIYDNVTVPKNEAEAEVKRNAAWLKNNKLVDDPLMSGYYEKLYGKDGKLDSGFNLGVGGGFDQDDINQLSDIRREFLSTYNSSEYSKDKRISANDFNKYILAGNLTFDDQIVGDEFQFDYLNEKQIDIDSAGAQEKLYNAILEFKGKASVSDIDEVQTYTSWKAANKGAFGETDEWWNNNANQNEIYDTFLKAGGNANPLDAKAIGDIRQTLSGAISEILTGENEALGTPDSGKAIVDAVTKLIKAENLSEKAAKDYVDELLEAKKQGGIMPMQDEMLTQLLAKFAK